MLEAVAWLVARLANNSDIELKLIEDVHIQRVSKITLQLGKII